MLRTLRVLAKTQYRSHLPVLYGAGAFVGAAQRAKVGVAAEAARPRLRVILQLRAEVHGAVLLVQQPEAAAVDLQDLQRESVKDLPAAWSAAAAPRQMWRRKHSRRDDHPHSQRNLSPTMK